MKRSKNTWIDEHLPQLKDKILITLSMEGCIPELQGDAREANAKGGLGVYFGDKLEGLNAIGIDQAFGCMPLYKKRLIQSIENGRQKLSYKEVTYEGQPVKHVVDIRNNPIQFDVWGWDITNTSQDKKHVVELYSINRGGTLLYLFYCPEVFDVLYPDDRTHYGFGREHRFLQETVFAECVYILLKTLNVVPDILHLNEGHVADAAAVIKGDKTFSKTSVVYTNHTVVPAGLERFYINRLTDGDVGRARYAMRFLQDDYEEFWRKFSVHQDGQCLIDFSKGALELCDVANGVSNEHALATQTLFPFYERKVEGVLNGSGDTWIMDELLKLELNQMSPSEETLIRVSEEGKALSFAEIKKRTAGITDKDGNVISEDGVTLDPDLPTVWMIRRMVKYKSQLPVLKDIIHVICANKDEVIDTRYGRMNGLQMQVVVGGIAPEGSEEEGWVEEFVSWMQRPDLRGRFVYVPNSDTNLLKMQGIGADICINCPMPQQEACGTSDQRSARNGGINIATRSGGPLEYIEDGLSGMLVGPYENDGDFYYNAPRDILGKLIELSEMYYNQTNGDSSWLDMKLQSYLASSKVTAAAMEQRYADIYSNVLHTRKSVLAIPIREYRKTQYVNEAPEFDLLRRQAASNKLDWDALLRSWSAFSDPHQGRNRELENSNLLGDEQQSYLKFFKNIIFPVLPDTGSISGNNRVEGSLLLFSLIGKYLELMKNDEDSETVFNSSFTNKQMTIIEFMLKELLDIYRGGATLKQKPQENEILQYTTESKAIKQLRREITFNEEAYSSDT
ncbi:MAG: glycogen/starch synthase [Sedimentisphaerales bacterium]|nr:glycogen/starch synthase [Sedimentisphaerales bacterium]